MSQKLFKNIGVETLKGGALQALKTEGPAGAFDFAVFTMTGVMVDQEVFDIGDDTYEFNSILTDTVSEILAAGGVNATATGLVFDQTPAIALLPGDVIRMETEFMIVVDANVNGTGSANVIRGAFGSTAAAHTKANSDTFQAAQPVAAGNLAVPLSAVAAATADGNLIGALNFWNTGYRKGLGGGTGITVQNSLKVTAVQGAGTTVAIGIEADGGVPATSDGLDSVTVDFIDGAAGEDSMEATDGTDFLDLGIRDGDVITLGATAGAANDGAFTVTGVDPRTVDAFGVEVTPSKISVATASFTAGLADAITVSQALGQTNATLGAFAGGVEPASQQYSKVVFQTTGTGALTAFAPFDVTTANVTVYGADGALIELAAATVSIVGARLVTVSAVGGQVAGGVVILEMQA